MSKFQNARRRGESSFCAPKRDVRPATCDWPCTEGTKRIPPRSGSPQAAPTATLTRAALGHILGVSPATVSRWVRTGAIPGPIPGTRRYSREAVFDRLRYGKLAAYTVQLSAFDQWMASRGQRQA